MASGTQHETEVLDQVIVRFAGDSGDGMQLTGDRFTTSSALLGNDLSTFPDFPAEIRAPAGTVNGVSAFQVHISDHDILTPGDSPNVLVAMNPAALKANIELMAKGTVLIVNSDSFEEREPDQGRLRREPPDRRLVGRLHGLRGADDLHHPGGLQGGRGQAPRRRAFQELLRAGPHQLDVHPSGRAHHRVDRGAVRRPAPGGRRQHRAFRAGYDFGETAELFESNYEVRPATFEKGEYVQVTGNQALAWGLIAASRLAGVPLFLGSYPITPASDILHELSRRKEFGVRTFQAEDEIAGIGAALGASFGGALGCHHDQRPGPRPQVRDHRPGHQPRAAPRHRRRAAGRALHRAADQDRAGRPAARHVRPARRGAPADPGAADAQRLLRRRHRGGPAGREVPHAGDRALRRLPGQRGRALAPARPRLLRADRARLRLRAQPRRRGRHRDVLALRARPRDPGPPVGAAGSAGPRAPHRRAGEGRRHRQRLLRRGQPRAHGAPPSRQDRRHRRRHPAGRGQRRDRGRPAAARELGLHLRRRGRGRQAGPGPRHEGGPRPPAPPLSVARPTWARCCTATPRCSSPR